jgi:hypothetical protein
MDKSHVAIYLRTAVLRTKKELPVSEYKDRSYVVTRHRHVIDISSTCHCCVVVMSLISHPCSD